MAIKRVRAAVIVVFCCGERRENSVAGRVRLRRLTTVRTGVIEKSA